MGVSSKLYFDVALLVLPTIVGGRTTAIFHNGGAYRPHAIAANDPTSTLLGIAVMAGPEPLRPGELAEVQLHALYHPQVNYEQLQQGMQFTVVEGRRIVAIGMIVRRWTKQE